MLVSKIWWGQKWTQLGLIYKISLQWNFHFKKSYPKLSPSFESRKVFGSKEFAGDASASPKSGKYGIKQPVSVYSVNRNMQPVKESLIRIMQTGSMIYFSQINFFQCGGYVCSVWRLTWPGQASLGGYVGTTWI